MKNTYFFKKIFLTISLVLLSVQAHAFELQTEAYVVGDVRTGHTLLGHNSRTVVEPASLTKMMTLYLLFDAIENGELTLESTVEVSEKAWRMGGSKMFIEVGKMIAVEDLIQGIAVSSGNDACIAIAERLGGTEEAFAEKMTLKAQELGLENTTFKNASGWPMEGHTSTAEDMFKLAQRLILDFPQYYHYFSGRSFTFSGITQYNRNGLLRRNVGVDGLKTGHTEDSGYHLVASGERDGLRLVSVVIGADSMREREGEALKGLSWGFGLYKNKAVAEKGAVLTQKAPVIYGLKEHVPLIAGASAQMLLKKAKEHTFKTELVYQGPLKAPLKSGTVIGKAVFSAQGVPSVEVPLLVGEDIGEKNIFGRLFDQLKAALFAKEAPTEAPITEVPNE